ncbi:hypothetical protein [Mycolicibacterium stellerae]|uniref:hypothetical protein n=1 Tax=Mycolicibacterium stellerae TaxID=2358193 RepID=UPI0013DE1D29|nr:hypothetical protein [Mycolicibacterium stellerae]
MGTTTTHVKCLAAALGATMVSVAVVTVPQAPAQAGGCQQWEFNGTFSLVVDGNDRVASFPAQGTHIEGRDDFTTHTVRGDITGDTLSMIVTTIPDQNYLWTGQIDGAGNVSGTGDGTPGWHSVGAPLLCKSAPPPQVTLRYDAPTLVGITAWVGMTNNAGKPAVDCTYNDGVLPPRPFSVYGDKETRIDLPGIPTGHVYNVVVTCGDLTHSEQKQF